MAVTRSLTVEQAVLRLGLSSAVFACVYGICNRLTHARVGIGQGVFVWEKAIPFVPWTILPYLSIVIFFALSFLVRRERAAVDRHLHALAINLVLSVLCYVLMPLRFTFERPLPDDVFGLLFGLLSAVDLPYNRAPSLHISVLLILWVRFAALLQGWPRRLLGAWFWLIALSVLTTYQHHVIDLPAGALVGLLSLALASRWQVHRGLRLGACLTRPQQG